MSAARGPALYQRGLTLIFLAFWAGLLFLLAGALDRLRPAAVALDPAAALLTLLLWPSAVYLAQALFYIPRRPAGPPAFPRARLFAGPLVFLPAPGQPRLETGPAFFAVAAPEDQDRLLTAQAARLPRGPARRMSRLLEARSPLDWALLQLAGRLWRPLALPLRLVDLLLSPARQITRLWGYFFFLAWRAWDDPGPLDETAVHTRNLAAILAQRGGAAPRTGAEETGQPWLAPSYRGVYLGLPAALYAASPDELYAPGPPEADLSLFYPPELAREVETAALLAAQSGFMAASLAETRADGGGFLDFDDRPWLSGRLLAARRELEDQRAAIIKRVHRHHARCRAAHLAAAAALGRDWPETLKALGAWLLWAERGRETLSQAFAALKKAKAGGRKPAPAEARAFGAVWADLQYHHLEAAAPLWGPSAALPDPPAAADWPAWETAVATLDRALAEIRDRALTALLAAEAAVKDGTAAGVAVGNMKFPLGDLKFPEEIPAAPAPEPPPPPRIHSEAAWLKATPGRSFLALLLLALALWQSRHQGLRRVVVYNGLEAAAMVTAGETRLEIPPFAHRTVRLRPGREYEFAAEIQGRRLESFRRRPAAGPGAEVYNLAGAAPLMEWLFPRSGRAEVFLGRPRWLSTRAAILFEDPPGGRRALVLSGYGDGDSPAELAAAFPDEAERRDLARLHAAWTPPGDPRLPLWLDQLPYGDRLAVLWARLPREPALAPLAWRYSIPTGNPENSAAAEEAAVPGPAADFLDLVGGAE